MAMREDCRFYESRTYNQTETVRMCRLDLAPEAPWRCPVDCPSYQRKLADAGWTRGDLGAAERTPEPAHDVSELLDSAENIINAVGAEIVAEVRKERNQERAKSEGSGGLKRFFRRLFRR